MKCSIGPANLKTFSRIIRFLAKISVEIHLEASENEMNLKAVNASKTSYVLVRFPKQFFALYHATDDEYDNNHCSISVKPMLSIFKGFKVSQSCIMELDGTNSKLIIEFTNKLHTKKTHLVTILEHEQIDNVNITNNYPNTIICRPHLFHSVLANFPRTIRELSFEVSSEKLVLKNHIDYPEKDVETVRLKTAMKKGEFATYDIGTESTVIFTTQDFKTIIHLAEVYQIPVKMCFSEEGQPFVVNIENEGNFSTQLVLATLKERTLRLLRKPKTITNYKELVNSFLTGNKRKVRNSDMGILDRARNTSRNLPGVPPHPRSLSATSRPLYTDSELRREILSPDIPDSITPSNPSERNRHSSLLPIGSNRPILSSFCSLSKTIHETHRSRLDTMLTQYSAEENRQSLQSNQSNKRKRDERVREEALLRNIAKEFDDPMDVSTPEPEKENHNQRHIHGHTNEGASTSKTPFKALEGLVFKDPIPLKIVENSNNIIAIDYVDLSEDLPVLSQQRPSSVDVSTPEMFFAEISRIQNVARGSSAVKRAYELNRKLFDSDDNTFDYGAVLVDDSDEEDNGNNLVAYKFPNR